MSFLAGLLEGIVTAGHLTSVPLGPTPTTDFRVPPPLSLNHLIPLMMTTMVRMMMVERRGYLFGRTRGGSLSGFCQRTGSWSRAATIVMS